MGQIGYGYGSEFHLLRYLGYHRHDLDRAIEEQSGGRVIDWLDSGYGAERKFPHLDAEWRGVDFVDPNLAIRSAWKTFWPQTGNIPNWDAVGLLASNSHIEYLLVEAKAHIEELHSSCGAKQEGGLGAIQRALRATLTHFQSSADADNWLSPYYQYANRLAHLDFLLGQNVSARLVLIYFLGDEWRGETLNTKKATCPKAEQEWRAELEKVDKHLGLTGLSELEKRVHKLFLHV